MEKWLPLKEMYLQSQVMEIEISSLPVISESKKKTSFPSLERFAYNSGSFSRKTDAQICQ